MKRALKFTIKQIRSARRHNEEEVYFYIVGNPSDFLSAVKSAPGVEKIVPDDHLMEPSHCSKRTKQLISWLTKNGYSFGEGYVAVLKE